MVPTSQTQPDRFSLGVWRTALALFVLAAATGVLLRFSFLHGLPSGLHFVDVRHAHSHLMFFGWATPVLMLLLLQLQGDRGSRAVRGLLLWTLLTAVASYVPFLLSGYRLMPVAGRELPVSMMVSFLCGIAWFTFTGMYLLRDRRRPPAARSSLFTAAALMLLLASLSVLALAVVGVTGGGPVLINALAFLFLEVFAEGWFGLAVLGLAWRLLPDVRPGRLARTAVWLLPAALTVRCLADVFVKTGSTGLEVLVYAGSAAGGLALLALLLPVWRSLNGLRPGAWHLSMALLALKGVFDVLLAVPALAALSDAAALNVFYLHAFLLGAVSIGLLAAVRTAWSPDWFRLPALFSVAVLVMVAALLPVSGIWPGAWTGLWTLRVAAWTSCGPVVVAAAALLWPVSRREPVL